jgi:hypothetical protein
MAVGASTRPRGRRSPRPLSLALGLPLFALALGAGSTSVLPGGPPPTIVLASGPAVVAITQAASSPVSGRFAGKLSSGRPTAAHSSDLAEVLAAGGSPAAAGLTEARLFGAAVITGSTTPGTDLTEFRPGSTDRASVLARPDRSAHAERAPPAAAD